MWKGTTTTNWENNEQQYKDTFWTNAQCQKGKEIIEVVESERQRMWKIVSYEDWM